MISNKLVWIVQNHLNGLIYQELKALIRYTSLLTQCILWTYGLYTTTKTQIS